ncbi:MAG TPA: amidase [Solirubrobacteraceae bacterium]|jgi:amidase|nr:amidase [Solirubrobacteraceae bacterium]
MPTATDLLFRPVDELAGLVRSGEISARELVQASLDRIEEVEPRLNAFVDVFGDEALAEADRVRPGDERPLAGVPVAIKNNVPVAGKRLTFGSPFLGDFAPPIDASLVTKLRRAGAIVVGTATLSEWGLQPVCETRRFGPTRNPWAPDRTPGGSSGGPAAAVASGMVPFAHGNDGGGSIRIPAACCGLVGLKPARGRISMAPAIGEQFLSAEGVLTRTVRDTAALLDLLAGPELGDASWAPPPPEPFAAAAAREPAGLRIALALDPVLETATLAPECEAAARDAAALLEDLGHRVEEVATPVQPPELVDTFAAVFGPMNCGQMAFGAAIAGREPGEEDMERLSMWLWRRCRELDAVTAYGALVRIQQVARELVAWAHPYDAVLTPSLAQPPVTIGTLDPDAPDPESTFARAAEFTPYTPVANMTGQPAISLPFSRRDDGVPIGVQLIGRPADEGTLLALGTQIEAARPWADRRPPL